MYSAPVSFILPYLCLLIWEFDLFDVTFIDEYLYEFISKKIRKNEFGYFVIQSSDPQDVGVSYQELFDEIKELKKKRRSQQ